MSQVSSSVLLSFSWKGPSVFCKGKLGVAKIHLVLPNTPIKIAVDVPQIEKPNGLKALKFKCLGFDIQNGSIQSQTKFLRLTVDKIKSFTLKADCFSFENTEGKATTKEFQIEGLSNIDTTKEYRLVVESDNNLVVKGQIVKNGELLKAKKDNAIDEKGEAANGTDKAFNDLTKEDLDETNEVILETLQEILVPMMLRALKPFRGQAQCKFKKGHKDRRFADKAIENELTKILNPNVLKKILIKASPLYIEMDRCKEDEPSVRKLGNKILRIYLNLLGIDGIKNVGVFYLNSLVEGEISDRTRKAIDHFSLLLVRNCCLNIELLKQLKILMADKLLPILGLHIMKFGEDHSSLLPRLKSKIDPRCGTLAINFEIDKIETIALVKLLRLVEKWKDQANNNLIQNQVVKECLNLIKPEGIANIMHSLFSAILEGEFSAKEMDIINKAAGNFKDFVLRCRDLNSYSIADFMAKKQSLN